MTDEATTEEPEIIDLDKPAPWESDPCFSILVQDMPRLSEILVLPSTSPHQAVHAFVIPPLVQAFCECSARLVLWDNLEFMRRRLHIKPKGRRGRPKGSGLKLNTREGEDLWKRGYTEGEIGFELKLSPKDLELLMARLRRARQRLPEDEGQNLSKLHREAKEARRKRLAAQRVSVLK